MLQTKVFQLVSSYEELITTFVELSQLKVNQKNFKNNKAKNQYLNERKNELLDEIETLRKQLNFHEFY